MNTIREVTEGEVSAEDQAALVACLKQWQSEGHTNPMIPSDIDADGDGTCDAFGLSPLGKLVFVSQVAVDDTVFEATGDGLEGGVA